MKDILERVYYSNIKNATLKAINDDVSGSKFYFNIVGIDTGIGR